MAGAHHSRQRGTTLIEALVAFLVVAVGALAVGHLQLAFRLTSDTARQRAEAVRLGEQDLETLRAFSVVAATSGARSYAEIASASAVVDGAGGYAANTRYLVDRSVAAAAAGSAKRAAVAVSWADRRGAAHRIVLNSIVGGIDPSLAASLGIAPTGTPVKGALARSAYVPLLAKRLDHGTSVLKPVQAGSVAFVFDDLSGRMTALCTGIAAAIATADLTSADLVGCHTVEAWLVSGTVRFDLATAPTGAGANDVPLDLAIVLTPAGGSYPSAPICASEAVKSVSFASGSAARRAVVPLSAGPAWLGLAAWTETGDRYVAYHCLVFPQADGRWSGRTTIAPSGWTIGTTAADKRICRYANDLDGSGSVDANVEHPTDYVDVDRPLANQNFLVIRGSQTCPTGAALEAHATTGDVYVDVSTVQQQP